MEQLRSVANKLGLIRIVEAQVKNPAAPAKITKRTVTLKDLETQIRTEEVQALAALPAELSVAFEEIFKASGIKPEPGKWTIDKLTETLSGPTFKGLDRAATQAAVLKALAAEKASVEEIVKDAVARDQAIDAFEGFVRSKMGARATARSRRLDEIESQLQALAAERDKLKQDARADEQQLEEWVEKKLACEKRMAESLGYLLDKPVITLTKT